MRAENLEHNFADIDFVYKIKFIKLSTLVVTVIGTAII